MGNHRFGRVFVPVKGGRQTAASASIGRVGGLAAALGVGVVLFATPWAAAADSDASSASASSESSSTSSAGTASAAKSTASSGKSEDSSASDGADADADADGASDSDDESDLDDELADEDEEDDDDSTAVDDTDAEPEDVDLDDEDVDDEDVEALDAKPDRSYTRTTSRVSTPKTPAPQPEPEVAVTAATTKPARLAPEPQTTPDPEPALARVAMSTQTDEPPTTVAEIETAPARALQHQPGTFIQVASSMLSAVIAPFMAGGTAPAAPDASPSMWGVLAWVRREIEDTFANYSVSIGGRTIIQHGTAVATSEGFGSIAIARGENTTATAAGLFSRAIVRGDDSTGSADGNLSRVRVRGSDNEVTSVGSRNRGTVVGDGNSLTLASENGWARTRVVGDLNATTAAAQDGVANISVVGDVNDATALATDRSRASITMRSDLSSAAAAAEHGSAARIRMLGDENSAVATSTNYGRASVRISGNDNVGSSDASNGAVSVARVRGDGNAASATDGKATVVGDGSIAVADGPGNVALVRGDGSTAIAGPGAANTAISRGDNLIADTGPGDNITVYGQPFDPDNQAPVAGTPGTQTVDPETGSVTATLGFSDPDGDTLTYTVSEAPDNGTVTFDLGVGTYTYTPATRPEFGEPDDADAFTVVASDGQASASTTINVPVTAQPEPTNQGPLIGTPGPQTVAPATGSVSGTLGFTDPDGDTLTYEVTSGPADGSVTFAGDTYIYTPDPDARPDAGQPDGADSFIVTATDPGGLTAFNTFNVPITAQPAAENQAPVAGTAGTQTVDPATGSVSATLGFTDPDGDMLTYEVSDGPGNGAVTFDLAAGTYTYTPATRPDFGQPDGADAFTVVATDPDGLIATNTIQVPVTALPDPGNTLPVTGGDAATVAEDSAATVIDVLANDSDPDGDTLTVTAVSTAANGTAAVSADGLSVTYTPDADFNGSDTFTYTVTDTAGGTGTATVTVTVTAVDDPASLGNDTATVAEDSGVTTIDVLANDTDPDGALTVTAVSTAANGTAAVSADGLSVTYTPNANFNGSDIFTYTVTDTAGGTGTATVSVTVTAVNDAPPVLLGLTEIPGDPARQPQIGPDGTAYQVVVFGFGTSNQRTSVYVVNPDGSVDLDSPMVDMAPGGPDSRLAFAPERFAYQTTFDYINQVGNVLVLDLENPGSYAIVEVGNDRIFDSELAVSPDGLAYVLPNNVFQPTLTVIDPEDPDTTTSVQLTGITPEGPIVFNTLDGTPYVAVELNDPDDMVQLYAIDIASPDDPLTLVAESSGQLANDGVAAGPDGAVYVTTRSVSADGLSAVTHVVMIDPDNPGTPVQFDLDGTTVLSVAVGPDGTAYQAVEEITIDGDDFSTLAVTTRVAVLDPANADNPVTVEIAGALGQQLVVGSDGTIYGLVTVADYSGFPTIVTTYQLVAIDPDNPAAAVTVDLEGEPTDFAVGDDGRASVISQTESMVGGETVYTTHLRIIDPDSPANPTLVDLAGNSVDVTVNPDGYVFVNTETLEAVGFVTHLSVVDPDNAADPILATYDIDGPSSFQAGAVVGLDGTVY